MKIKMIVPSCTDTWTEPAKQICDKYKESTTEITIVRAQIGPQSIECNYDLTQSYGWVLEEADKSEAEGYDAILFFPAGYPIDGIRESVNIPVFETLVPTFFVAASLGRKVAVITPLDIVGKIQRDIIKLLGIDSTCYSFRAIKTPVLDTIKERNILINLLYEESKKAIEEDDADVIVLACACFYNVADELSEKLDVPVLEPLRTGLKYVEMIWKLGLHHSKRAYPKPQMKCRVGIYKGPYSI